VLPSINIVFDEVRRRLDFQFELLASHDFKASIVLGTDSVVIAILLAALPLAQSQLDNLSNVMEYKILLLVMIVISLFTLFGSIILSVIVLWIRNYNRPPSLDRLRHHYIAEPVDATQLQLIDSFMEAIDKNEKTVKRQSSFIKIATVLLIIGLLILICLLVWFILLFLKVVVL
jgi:hypothetical protein